MKAKEHVSGGTGEEKKSMAASPEASTEELLLRFYPLIRGGFVAQAYILTYHEAVKSTTT
jgi:hypothetical protein